MKLLLDMRMLRFDQWLRSSCGVHLPPPNALMGHIGPQLRLVQAQSQETLQAVWL